MFFFILLVFSFSIAAMDDAMSPIKTDYAIFLFENGETNFIRSMLCHAAQEDAQQVADLDFKIVFMGASLDTMEREPFCRYPDKLLTYKQLEIEQEIDRHWPRCSLISAKSIENLTKKLVVAKKIWTGSSATVFSQIMNLYREQGIAERVALYDYLFAHDTALDAQQESYAATQAVTEKASMVAIASRLAYEQVKQVNNNILVVGHPPTEEYAQEANTINTAVVRKRMGLDEKPIVLYVGAYGIQYEQWFEQFLDCVEKNSSLFKEQQLLILPHPRFKGAVEKRLAKRLDAADIAYRIVGEYETDSRHHMKSIEAVNSAAVIITSNATSTMVAQANTLGKRVIHVTAEREAAAELLNAHGIITSVTNHEAFEQEIRQALSEKSDDDPSKRDIFQILGMPKKAAARLWELFKQ